MAEPNVRKFELTLLEVQWLRKAIETQRLQLFRSRSKEMDGSEIYVLRSRELDALIALHQKFS